MTDSDVVKRTSNSVRVQVTARIAYRSWQEITVGGSVIFAWKVHDTSSNNLFLYFVRFCKKTSSDKMNYTVTYTHWKTIDNMDTAVMSVCTDHDGAYYLGTVEYDFTNEVTVEISTYESSLYASIYDDTELTDFMLRGEDGSVSFHKVVLAAHSSVFKTMLAGDWKETSEGVIDVPGTSKKMLQHLKMYIYLGKLPKKQNEQMDCLKQLLLLSSCYLIEDLKLRCLKELRFLVTKENLFEMMQFAIENKITRLLINILDCANMCDVDLKEVQKYLEAEDATTLINVSDSLTER